MIDSPEGQINYPHLRLRPSKGLWSRHFALQGPSTSLPCCFQNYRETWTLTKTTAANIDCAILKTHIFSFFLKFGWPRPPHCDPPVCDHIYPFISYGRFWREDSPLNLADLSVIYLGSGLSSKNKVRKYLKHRAYFVCKHLEATSKQRIENWCIIQAIK